MMQAARICIAIVMRIFLVVSPVDQIQTHMRGPTNGTAAEKRIKKIKPPQPRPVATKGARMNKKTV